MDRIEAIKVLNRFPVNYTGMTINEANRVDEALAMATRALCPVSREQAKQAWPPCSQCKPFIDMGVESFSVGTDDGREFEVNYCTKCGRPMSDIAWDDWANRVEALKDGKVD